MYNAKNIMKDFESRLKNDYHTDIASADTVTVHNCLSAAVMDNIYSNWHDTADRVKNQKQACYLSAEFLVGRAIYNNLYCLGLLDEVDRILQEKGFDINRFEEVEDAALGNGGLGRLAACFLDSAATHSLPLAGYGIRYKYGLFKQRFEDGFQKEAADDWAAQGDPWSVRKEAEKVRVEFSGQTVWAVPYDMPVIGYGTDFVGTLRLWQSEAVNAFDFEQFNSQKYDLAVSEKNSADFISMVLYPNDDTAGGKILRIKQEYFFTSASMQDILRSFKKLYGTDYGRIPAYYAVQLNDTHPVMAIPELVRLLMNEGLSFDRALQIAGKTFAFTNHSVMEEALEKWSYKLFASVVPGIAAIIKRINQKLTKELKKSSLPSEAIEKRAIICNNTIHIARLAVFVCFAVNGVAQIHTDIIKNKVFKEWFEAAPEKFQNKTNGITQRRWLGLCNRELSEQITRLIGDGWQTDLSMLKKLEQYKNDAAVIKKFAEIKALKKKQLSEYILEHEGVALNENFLFDIQVKRLHEYKRQLLNALSIVNIYFKLKDGSLTNFQPTAFIFGAKAAPGYYRAKGIVKFINEVSKRINSDSEVSDKLKVVFIQNYNVSYAEKLMPAADISEQISTAGTEASGTGNMKLMLNGAVTLGTYDGANIEIVEQAGIENNYIFGGRVEELEQIKDTYDPKVIYCADADLKRAVDTLIDGTFEDGGTGVFRELYNSMLIGASWHKPDNYFLFYDFDDYMQKKLTANREYAHRIEFSQKCWLNIANAGKFSSDRTVLEYAKDIWSIQANA